MKPLKLQAAFKEYLWGGTKLNDIYGKRSGMERTAESWELSTHPDGLSVIVGGEQDGTTLAAYIAADPSVLGTARTSDELPVLVKLIDAAADLSVQVHPNNEQAQAWEGQNGKTEMWYVIAAEPGARIVYGVKERVSPTVFAEAIRDNTVVELLDSIPSRKGQAFFVEAGTVHAIGAGNLIAEIQQNSNVTYRLYDYDRRDKDGNPRELHIDKGVRAAVLEKTVPPPMPLCDDGTRLLSSCPYFEVRELTVRGTVGRVCTEESYHYLLVTEGTVVVADVPLHAGEGVFLPAGLGAYTVTGDATVLLVANPPVAVI